MSRNPLRTRAYLGMCAIGSLIGAECYGSAGLPPRRDPVALADLRTSMDDWRAALSLAIGRRCDRNGYFRGGDQ